MTALEYNLHKTPNDILKDISNDEQSIKEFQFSYNKLIDVTNNLKKTEIKTAIPLLELTKVLQSDPQIKNLKLDVIYTKWINYYQNSCPSAHEDYIKNIKLARDCLKGSLEPNVDPINNFKESLLDLKSKIDKTINVEDSEVNDQLTKEKNGQYLETNQKMKEIVGMLSTYERNRQNNIKLSMVRILLGDISYHGKAIEELSTI